MSNTGQHPSYFDLDCYALGEKSLAVESHLRDCVQCQAYAERLAQGQELPAWARRASQPRGWRHLLGFKRQKTLWMPTIILAGAAATVLLMVQAPTSDGQLRVREKGLPAVAVFVKHGDGVVAWRESDLLEPGDQVRLQIAPASASHVTVLSCQPAAPRVMYAGTVSGESSAFLPTAWQLDAAPAPEVLVVVFGDAALTPADLPNACRGKLPQGAQQVTLTLRKRLVQQK